ncbi:MAG TPA: coproporphyrinogen dehydrogenase HemZ [Firmicutes bacterium]|nr:coproporphyrinogen dehydrogenase HemZ [Bacillota bacterium]
MTIIIEGHTVHNQLENLCKLFFPCIPIHQTMSKNDCKDPVRLYTRYKNRRTSVCLLAVFVQGDKKYAARQIISQKDADNRKLVEQRLCAAAYQALSTALHFTLPWGILTGIRPVKLIQDCYERGLDEVQTREYMGKTFHIGKEKLDLCIETAENQTAAFSLLQPHSCSLYVSIPYCPTRCRYCSFVSHSISSEQARKTIPAYIDHLCQELAAISERIDRNGLKLETIYFGGGTPTSITAEQLKMLTDCIARLFDISTLREYTVEAGRPDTITAEKLRVLKKAGVDRISINPQTFNDSVLEQIGRCHTSAETERAFALARQEGFQEINMDFIAGLPTDTFESFQQSMYRAVDLGPENITVHTLSIKRSSDLYTRQGLGQDLDAYQAMKMVNFSGEFLREHGYKPYYLYRNKNTLGNLENIGYMKAGHISLYNTYIMEENHTIFAAGAGGVTKLVSTDRKQINRIFNFKYPYEYLKRFDQILERKKEIDRFYEQYAVR